ncbi:hypothetical protein M9458_044994, partial [Cirrhinus mrigala]
SSDQTADNEFSRSLSGVGGQTSPNSSHHATTTITSTGTRSTIIHYSKPGSKHRFFAVYCRLSHGSTGALLWRGGGLQGVLTAMGGINLDSYNSFAQHFLETTSAGEELYHLRQGSASVQDGWNEQALLTTFRQGLEPNIRLMLAPHDDSIGLERFIQLAIRCSARVHSYTTPSSSTVVTYPYPLRDHSPPEPIPEPMSIDTRRLTQTERQRRMNQRLCLYCGKSGHGIRDCPTRPPRPVVSSIMPMSEKLNPLTTVVTLTAENFSISVAALIDSGSAGNFIAGHTARQLRVKTTRLQVMYQIQSVTGQPLSKKNVTHQTAPLRLQTGLCHEEEIQLLVLEGSTIDVVLGRPWLARHEPILSWGTGEVLKWGPHCWPKCFPQLPLQAPASIPLCSTSIESPIEKQSVEIPPCYEEFNDVFCPKRAARLPPHRPWDCAIDLLPAAQVPHGKIYPLSIPETKAMEDYIQEALAQGYIRPSTSLLLRASSSSPRMMVAYAPVLII